MFSSLKTVPQLLWLLLLLTFLKGIVMSIIVPPLEFPDEQVHFGQVSYFVETGTTFDGADQSNEIVLTQKYLGVYRDMKQNNTVYTYRPDFKIAYTDSTSGLYENLITQIPTVERTNYVRNEVARYQPLFYHLSSIGYRLSYGADILTRLFWTRMVSVLITVGSVFIAYLVGKELWSKSEILPITLAALVMLHPMFSFVGSGVNNDNLLNLLSMILIWLSLSILRSGLTTRKGIGIGLAAGMGIITKPLIFPLLPVVGLVILYEWWSSKRTLKQEISILMPLLIVGVIAGGWLFLRSILLYGELPYWPKVTASSSNPNLPFFPYLKDQLGLYYRETLVWYWGVFKWLGLIMPLWSIRLIKIGLIISGIGLFKFLFFDVAIHRKKSVVLLGLFAVVYVVALTLWDYQMRRNVGFSHGLQGRYFFPTIISHLSLILVGVMALVPRGFKDWIGKFTVLSFVFLNFLSWWTLIKAYYSTESVRTLFLQMSQYKPLFLKYPYSLIWFGLYIGVLGYFLISYVLKKEERRQKKSEISNF